MFYDIFFKTGINLYPNTSNNLLIVLYVGFDLPSSYAFNVRRPISAISDSAS